MGDLDEVMRVRVHHRVSVCMEEDKSPELTCSHSLPCEGIERRHPQTRKRALMGELYQLGTLILDFSAFRTVRSKLFKPLNLWYVVMAAQAKTVGFNY